LVTSNTIIYTSWERDKVFPQLIEELKQVAQVWVPCFANKRAFVDSGMPEHKVKVIPYPYDPASCTIAAPRGREEVPPDLRFYHIGKWEPRKNQHQLIGAFLLAFTPKDRASLLIKTSGFGSTWASYPPPEESVKFWLEDAEVQARGWTQKSFDRVVRIITDRISDEDIRRLHETNNIYVSCGHGEAWDIPAFEAKLAGNRLVYMGYGGPEDYADKDDVKLMTDMKPVHSQYDWEPDAQWGAVPTEVFAGALRRAKPPELRVCPPSYVRRYSYAAVGQLMQQALKDAVGESRMQDLRMSGGFG
jgi:glycosyltransferase involved in cell wall biosynthesis